MCFPKKRQEVFNQYVRKNCIFFKLLIQIFNYIVIVEQSMSPEFDGMGNEVS